jgi:hypothetical protein
VAGHGSDLRNGARESAQNALLPADKLLAGRRSG